ncbi:hypothetical protein FEK33_29345 [Nocardia asteroides NBRC 15531]|nr:hypothetical protein [Nocardia asteroides]TLF62552.1 hypothetical protein FEK33_29345 [Nocardia asteroides NBRC 15531]UGT46770.1 hypothetical protein LT345_19755 [Nocardia asteroides]
MADQESRTSRRVVLPWGELEIFAPGFSVPALLQHTAAALSLMDERFLSALLTFHQHPPAPVTAVWPANRSLPAFTESADLTLDEMTGVVLGEVHTLTCHVCGVRLRAVYPDAGVPFFGNNLSAHRLINECPTCGTGFSRSRIQALAVIPSP